MKLLALVFSVFALLLINGCEVSGPRVSVEPPRIHVDEDYVKHDGRYEEKNKKSHKHHGDKDDDDEDEDDDHDNGRRSHDD